MNKKLVQTTLAVMLMTGVLMPSTLLAATFGVENVGDTDYPGFVSYNSGGTQIESANHFVIDDAGNIYIAGQQGSNGTDWLVQKYDSNGVPVDAWGTDGSVTYDAAGGFDFATGILVDDDSVYVAGSILVDGGLDAAVRKYSRTTGNLDASWAISGMFTYNSTSTNTDFGRYVVESEDGGLYLLAQTSTGGGKAMIIKLDASGDIDTDWGDGGSVAYNLSGNASPDNPQVMVRDDDGNFYIGTSALPTGEGRNIIVAKALPSGALDTTWGSDGITSYNSGGSANDDLRNVVLLPDGSIYAIGFQASNANDAVILRYNSSGILDSDWSDNGILIYDSSLGSDQFVGGVVDESGNLYVSGTQGGNSGDLIVHKYDSGGDLDTTWGTSGMFVWSSGGSSVDVGQRIAFNADGRLVVVGAHGTNGGDIAALRLTEDGILDISFGNTPVPNFPQGYILASKGVLPDDGTIESVSFYGATTIGTTTLAIYNGDFELVWESDEIVSDVSEDWLTVPIASGTPATLELESDTYYLAFQLETTDDVPTYTGRAEEYDGFFFPQAYGAFPDTISDPVLSNINWSIYATYTPVPTPEEEEDDDTPAPPPTTSSSRKSSGGGSSSPAATPASGGGAPAGSVEALMQQLIMLLQQLLEQLIAERNQ